MTATWSGHRAYVGMTGSGKTTAAAVHFLDHAGPGLFFDPQDTQELAALMPRANRRAQWGQLMDVARRHKVRYMPSAEDDRAAAELAHIIGRLLHVEHDPPFLLVVDEADLYAPEGAGRPSALHMIARRGRRWGIELWVLSRRPAEISKGIITQCTETLIFSTSSYESGFFAKYGIPGENARELVQSAGPHYFVRWNGVSLVGPERVVAPNRA